MSSRASAALKDPPDDIAGFPSIDVDQDWYRAHNSNNGPWWFSNSGEGRFDLAAPHGSCYLASTAEDALREKLGPTLVQAGRVFVDALQSVAISRLAVSARAADTTHNDAVGFGVTRELATITPYDIPQAWATALHASQFEGVHYWPRFALGQATALALFGAQGEDSARSIDEAPLSAVQVAASAGIGVLGMPRRLPTVEPPA